MLIAYHPQTDKQMEHINQALEKYLTYYIDYNLSNWSDLLLSAEFAYNNLLCTRDRTWDDAC